MAIYSLHHSNVGKATQAQPGTAGAHVRYITRTGAARLVMAEHMPADRDQARSWMDEREATDRKNGRVIDKVMVALPVELDAAQRADLVREFAAAVGGGRIAWMAAVHDRGEDAHNPHAHIILRDKDQDTGKRVFGTSEKGSTDRLREIWEDVANQALERAGFDARIDRRSLAEQGLDREAGLHVGPNVLAMEERGLRPVSQPQEVENGRVIDWPEIDQGRTRADRQREIEAGNLDAEREREKGKDKDQGRAHVMTPTPEAMQRAIAWAEREADRRAEAQRQTEELLALARQAMRPKPQLEDPAPAKQSVPNPRQDDQREDTAAEILAQPAMPASRTIQDQADQAMQRAAARWKIEPDQPAKPAPEPTPQRPRIDYLARIRQRPPASKHQADQDQPRDKLSERAVTRALDDLARTDPLRFAAAAAASRERHLQRPEQSWTGLINGGPQGGQAGQQNETAEDQREKTWMAQGKGFDALNREHQARAKDSFAAWQTKRDRQQTGRDGFTLQEYVEFVQKKEAQRLKPERDQRAEMAGSQSPHPPPPQGPESGGAKIAGQVREAIQRPSYEAVRPDRAEIGRMAQLVTAARSRLAGLVDRLEQAFEPFRQRQADQQTQPRPAWQPPPRPEPVPPKPEPQQDWADGLLARARQRQQEQAAQSLQDEIRRRRGPKGPGF